MVQQVIDSLPPTATLAAARDLKAAVRGTNDVLAQLREDLVTWLCYAFSGFMVSAPDRLRIPSMPGTMQFLVLNSGLEREKAFTTAASGAGLASGPVFHGTNASRLLPILIDGLKVMSGGPGQIHGSAIGSGIYCGDDPGTSWGYSGQIGQNWKGSTIGGLKIMLGCELAGYTAAVNNIHVVNPQERVLVRYVFLLPTTFQCPPRRHVDQALSTAFSQIRTGM
jgi:hypothetical protein